MRRMHWFVTSLVALGAAGIWSIGCSSDDASPGPAADAGQDTTRPTSDAKKETAPPAPTMCSGGTDTCADISVAGLLSLPACCSVANKKCGNDISALAGAAGMLGGLTGSDAPPPMIMLPSDTCIEKNQPGEKDPSCPGQSLAGLLTLDGCCKPSGDCGALLNTVPLAGNLGFGCVAADTLGPIDGGIQHCTYVAPEAGSEGGAEGGADGPTEAGSEASDDGGGGDAADEAADSGSPD